MAPAPQQASDRQHQPDPFVPGIGIELGEAERQAGHPQPDAQHPQHRERGQPMQRLGGGMIARLGHAPVPAARSQRHASVAMVISTVSPTMSTYLVMPNWERLMAPMPRKPA